jgi:acyl-CoA reductase-like NAD-dependent aldehyde dehydrogenase
MTATEAPAPATFESLDPRTGDVVGTHPVHDEAAVRAAVARAASAAEWWDGIGAAERRRHLAAWRTALVRKLDDLAAVVVEETGKPLDDARLELVLAIDHLDWAAKHAEKVLGRRKVAPGLLMGNQAASLTYRPYGVIGVIGPWNYPVFTPMGSIAYALAAGNAVVFKPSELTPGVGVALADTFAEIVDGRPVLQVVTGFGETGAALCRAPGIGKIAFTGSTATGKRVMAACAESLTPVLVECGGKDPMIVDVDADLDAAADAAVWGGMSNAGQTCVGVERVYVHERVYDDFVSKVVTIAKDVRAGDDPEAKIGPITMPRQLEVIRRHITDALARGGRALVGGAESVGDRYAHPTVLVDVPEDAAAVREETFGPTLTIAKVADMDEAVTKANDSKYGLASTVFSKRRGMELAQRLRSGMTAVNNVISFAGIPSLPFGGIGESGFGRIHGPEGLKEFARSKAITRQRFRAPLVLTTFGRTAKTDATVAKLVTLLHGKRR